MRVRLLVDVDTSALGALLIAQVETEALVDWLDSSDAALVSSDPLEPELRCTAVREGRDQGKVTQILDGVSLAALDRAVHRSAGLLPMPYLRMLGTLHLEAAIQLEVDAVLTYDRRLGEAAEAVGIDVVAPGATHLP